MDEDIRTPLDTRVRLRLRSKQERKLPPSGKSKHMSHYVIPRALDQLERNLQRPLSKENLEQFERRMRLVDPRSTENYVLPNTEFLQAIKDIGASIAEEKPQYTKQLLTEALFAIGFAAQEYIRYLLKPIVNDHIQISRMESQQRGAETKYTRCLVDDYFEGIPIIGDDSFVGPLATMTLSNVDSEPSSNDLSEDANEDDDNDEESDNQDGIELLDDTITSDESSSAS